MPKDITVDETRAVLYRMTAPNTCPSGLKALHLLRRQGFQVEDRPLTSRAETDALKARLGVETTPQIILGGERVGGYEALRQHLGKPVRTGPSYRPVLVIFAIAALVAMAISWRVDGVLLQAQVLPWFVATAMVLLGLQKLQDVERFSTMFLTYDLLAKRWVPYGYVYPFVETAAGLLMLAGLMMWLAVPAMLVIGAIGAVSVFKAVYIEKRELKCACVGGGSNVPLGAVSLMENLAMMAMGLWGVSQLF
ncbi:MAG: MauE/DoxX family redox-associated membrane protein [Pseudomonadota bacterium]